MRAINYQRNERIKEIFNSHMSMDRRGITRERVCPESLNGQDATHAGELVEAAEEFVEEADELLR